MMRLAGRRYFFAGVIRYEGRHSGREYATPIWAVPTTDGFVVSLPTAGRGTIKNRGETWTVAEPEMVDLETARALLPRRAQLLFGLAGIERCVKLKRL